MNNKHKFWDFGASNGFKPNNFVSLRIKLENQLSYKIQEDSKFTKKLVRQIFSLTNFFHNILVIFLYFVLLQFDNFAKNYESTDAPIICQTCLKINFLFLTQIL